MEKKERQEKRSKFGKSVLWAVLSYVLISVIAGICSVLRGSMQGESGATVSWFVILELVLFPVLFFAAGYLGSKKYDFERFQTYKIWLYSVGFSVVLMLLWYVLLDAYVVLNLPTAEGSLAPDLFLRKITVVQEYEIKYLKETNGYRYVILPMIHFVFRILYWMFYSLGNRKYVSAQKEISL